MSRIVKRHILLLEVLIALAIVLTCIVPMLQPQLFMLTEEKKFIREVELDRLVGVLYANLLVDQFYRANITWDQIVNGQPTAIDDPSVGKLGFKGTYSLALKARRGKLAEDVFARNLITITFTFTSGMRVKPLIYSYDLFVLRVPGVEEPVAQDTQPNKATPVEGPTP